MLRIGSAKVDGPWNTSCRSKRLKGNDLCQKRLQNKKWKASKTKLYGHLKIKLMASRLKLDSGYIDVEKWTLSKMDVAKMDGWSFLLNNQIIGK